MRQGQKGTRTPEIFVALVVVLIAVLAFISIRDVMFAGTQQGDKKISGISEMPLISIESASGTMLVVRNKGTYSANMTLVRAYVDDAFVACKWDPEMLSPGMPAACELPFPCSGSSVKISSGTQDAARCD